MNKFLKVIIFLIFISAGLFLGWRLGEFVNQAFLIPLHPYWINVFAMILIAGAGALIAPLFSKWVIYTAGWLNRAYHQLGFAELLLGFLGLILGLLVAYLINIAANLASIPIVGPLIPFVLAVLFAYIGLTLFLSKKEELSGLLPLSSLTRDRLRSRKSDRRYLLDTNVIIDGRVVEVLKSGIIDGVVVIPSFVLSELQYVADSTDPIRRARGRRGLDTLNRIQKESPVKIDFQEIKLSGEPVDQKLIKLAKSTNATLITNDFNLVQVARLQMLNVINLNELSNALKPVVLPGEEIQITITKEGKESNQGVGYLDDGTMVVVEEGKRHIGETIALVVTSILQTSAGRMIFARPVEES